MSRPKTHAVGAVSLQRSVARTNGLNHGQVAINLAVRELPSLVTYGTSFTSVQTAGTHWLADAVLRLE